MTPRRLGVLLICLFAGCAKNRCRERVDELKTAQVELNRVEAANEPRKYFSLGQLAKGDEVAKLAPSNKRPTFVIRAKREETIEADPTIGSLRALGQVGMLRACAITTDVKLNRSKTADATERTRALGLVKDVTPEDRATVLSGELAEVDVCKVGTCIGAVSTAAPSMREAIIAGCVAEELEACGFPRRGSERVFALTTVMLDTWDYAQDCVSFEVTMEASAPAVTISPGMSFGELMARFRGHEGKSVRVEP